MKGRFCVSIVKTVKNKIFKSSLSALFLHWAGPHPLHHRSPVLQPQAAGKCHVCLQASPDRGKQAAHGTAGSLSSWIPLCLQGNAMSLCVPIPPCPQKQVILCEYLFVTSLSDNAAEPVYVNIMQTCPFKFYMHTSFSRNTSVPFYVNTSVCDNVTEPLRVDTSDTTEPFLLSSSVWKDITEPVHVNNLW